VRGGDEDLTMSDSPKGIDYASTARPFALKSLVRRGLLLRPVNRVAVGMLRLLPDYAWKRRVPAVSTAHLDLGGGQGVRLLRADRCQVAKEVFWAGGALQDSNDRLALDLAIGLSANARLFLDIGAYTGLFALAVAKRNPQLRAHAYEIVADNFVSMWENVIANDLVGRVEPRLVGLGATEGQVRVPASLGGGALASSIALDSDSADGVTIPVMPLDSLYATLEGHVVFKIDVEGFEWDVLQGGRGLIARTRPDIVCEILRRAPCIPQIEAFLDELGYRRYHITHAGLRSAERIVPVKEERDWLFTPRSRQELSALAFPMILP